MKYLLILLLSFLLFCRPAIGQETEEKDSKVAVSIGVLHGGGSLVGVDFEFLLGNRFGIQAGAGLTGFGGGITYHLKPDIRSSMITLQYYHQGVGDSYTQSMLGPVFVYRAKKLFTASLGLGYALEKGPNFPDNKTQPPVMLLYSIGIYLPFKYK